MAPFVIILTLVCIPPVWIGGGYLVRRRLDRRLRRATRDAGVLALTYDDGPATRFTPALLDLLHRHEAKGTFFMVGRQAEGDPELVQRIADEGHTICWHSQTHRNQWKTDPIRGLLDIWKIPPPVQSASHRFIAFRPPYGKLTLGTVLTCILRRWRIITWTHVSGDTHPELPSVDELVSRVDAHGGGVVLMHDLDRPRPERGDFVLAATTALLELAERRGWKVAHDPGFWRSVA